MSKQEKLAAFLRAFGYWHGSRMSMVPVSQAWGEYLNTPDDPPQPPEMPECVAKLLDSIQRFGVLVNTSDYVQQVRDHYRQPLKLEVGKVYEDDAGTKVQVVFENKQPGTKYPFLCVFLDTATPYYSDGFSLIREVKQ